jgi:glycosyltransferase involved in cell wall biosynthesis
MRILFIAGTLGTGGAERQLFLISTELKRRGHSIAVFSFTQGEYYESLLINSGIIVYSSPRKKGKWKRLCALYRACQEFNPNLLFSFHFFTNVYAAIFAYLFKIKSVGSVRSAGIAEKKHNGIFSWLHYALPNLICVNSENAIINLNRIFYTRDNYLLQNIIDLSYFELIEKVKKDSIVRLLFIGRYEEVKRPHEFLNLCQKLVLSGILKFEGFMLGNGPLLEDIKARVEAENLPITVYPFQKDIYPFIQKSDILVSTSSYEGSPNVLLESLACGIDIYVLSNGCYRVFEEQSLIHSYDTSSAMAESIARWKEPTEEMKRKKRSYIELNHSSNIISDNLLKKIEKVCSMP